MRIILASESEFRRRALDILGLDYDVYPSSVDEKSIRDADPVALTRKLSEAKALKVVEDVPNAVIVSGDAVVAKDGTIYEKPRDKREAKAFLAERQSVQVCYGSGRHSVRYASNGVNRGGVGD